MIRGHHTTSSGFNSKKVMRLPANEYGGGLISFAGIMDLCYSGNRWSRQCQVRGRATVKTSPTSSWATQRGGRRFWQPDHGSLVISGPISGKPDLSRLLLRRHLARNLQADFEPGVRYELQGPWSERYDKMSYFNPSLRILPLPDAAGVAGSGCPGESS